MIESLFELRVFNCPGATAVMEYQGGLLGLGYAAGSRDQITLDDRPIRLEEAHVLFPGT